MERLTSDKQTSDMNIFELAYNSCYADKNHNARYRDYELDIDSRELIKNLAKDMCNEDLSNMSDEEFDEYMAEMLSVEVDSQIGLLALFYRNLWAMADLREKLKYYEDLEEQDRLLKLPCTIGDTVYLVGYRVVKARVYGIAEQSGADRFSFEVYTDVDLYEKIALEDYGDSWFTTKSEAEAKLKLKSGENGSME